MDVQDRFNTPQPEIPTEELLRFKTFPADIKQEVTTALGYFPELKDIHIDFIFRERKMSSFMQAQPRWRSLFRSRISRRYVIRISRAFDIEGEHFTVEQIPSEILVGWLGHELGHIMDYLDKSTMNLIAFGASYLFSGRAVQTTERSADINAILHGMGDFIFNTRNFILDHTELPEKYKDKIRRLYLSPPEILELIEEHSESEIKETLASAPVK